ncbi:MAG: replication initiator protein A [Hyphomicrobium sp.]|nr:replication initiator protein A [Hyphomicrobium sp.]
MSALLPERHPVRDFFIDRIELDAVDVTPRSDMASMGHPIFSLATHPDMRTLRYENDQTIIEIHPSSKGLATIFDKDILIYAISKLMDRQNRGAAIGQVVRITAHDLLVATNRQTGGITYERLENALDRLAGTRIKTNITTGSEVTRQNFGIIEWYEYNRKGSGFAERLKFLDIKLSDWLYRTVTSAEVLPISRDYFRLRRPIDRRLYEIARKHCGRQPSWRIGSELLQKKCGSKQEGKHFAAHLRELARSDHLPDYRMTLEGEQAVFWRRGEGLAKSTEAGEKIVKPTADRAIRISQAAFDTMRERAPGWDKYMLESMYIEWAKTKDAARHEDARFLRWVTSYTKGKAAP